MSFQVDPGLMVRSAAIPGLIDASWDGTAERPVWTARLDPPLKDGDVLMLDLWRPVSPPAAEEARTAPADRPAGESVRRFPYLEPTGVERYSGLLGLRRPGHWTGRLEPVVGTDSLSDESFVKLWGPLPDDRLTLAGTCRLSREYSPSLLTGPARPHVKIKPSVLLSIQPGRIDVQFEADLDDVAGTLDRLEMAIPPELVVLSVHSDALSAWSRPGPGRLVLRYDRVFSRSRRQLKLSGWIPVAEDPLRTGSQPLQRATPWVEVLGMDASSSTLTIVSPTSHQVSEAAGLAPRSGEPATGASGVPTRQIYRVSDPTKLGLLKWSSAPPGVNVQIESQITVNPESAEWTAVLRYRVLGGALDSIHLRLSPSWAANAQVVVAGGKFDVRSDALGPFVLWKITPAHAVWGVQHLVVRSSIRLLPGQELQFPEIAPLGYGSVDTYLGLVYATGRPLTTAGSSGLHEVRRTNHFTDAEFGEAPGTSSRAFHVQQEIWSLKVQVPVAADDTAETASESAVVTAADIDVTVLPDQSVQGRAVYETRPRSGRFLVAEVPTGSELVHATVDQTPTSPFRSSDGKWLVPLGGQGPGRVSLFWNAACQQGDSHGFDWSLMLPRAGLGRISTLLTLHLPETLAAKPSLAGLELTVPDRMELERADRIAQQISDFIAQIDRSSGRDRERATALLIAHELALRSAEQSLRDSARAGDRTRKERAERDLEVIQSTRKALLELLRTAAMDDELEAARSYLGLSSSTSASFRAAVPEPAGPDRLRHLGRPSYLIGLSSGLNEPPTRVGGTVESPTSLESVPPDRARLILTLGLLVLLLPAALVRRHPATMCLMMLAGCLGMLALLGGPAAVICGLLPACLGWSKPAAPRAATANG